MAFSHRVKLPVNDTACLCWQGADKEVPSGISCHSFSPGKELRVATLFLPPPFLLGGAPFPPLFGWKEKFTTTKPSTLIKSAAKPSTTKEHNIWGRWVIPPLNLEAGTEFQMSIITAGEGSEGRRHTDTHVLWWKLMCYWPLAHCSRAELKCPSFQNVTLGVWVCEYLCFTEASKPISSKTQTFTTVRFLTILAVRAFKMTF